MAKKKGGSGVVNKTVTFKPKVDRKARAVKAATKKASRTTITPRGTARLKARKQADLHNLYLQNKTFAAVLQEAA